MLELRLSRQEKQLLETKSQLEAARKAAEKNPELPLKR